MAALEESVKYDTMSGRSTDLRVHFLMICVRIASEVSRERSTRVVVVKCASA
jgi:hypothetical protein